MGGKEAYEKRSKELIVPCIASFAGAIQDDSLHKQLVYQTLLKTRHVKSYVRSSALNALVRIFITGKSSFIKKICIFFSIKFVLNPSRD